MADSSEQEPSIEEILASIRQIISDDEEQLAEAAPAPEPEPEPEPAPPPPKPKAEAPPPPPPKPKEDVFELTEVLDEPKPEPKRVEIDLRDSVDDESILTHHAASATLEGFARLAANMAIDRKGTGAVTLEDIVREMLRPLLRDWLDTHLPPIIERMVQKELDRLAQQAIED